jgi:2-polyprenyl-3-methyl-5-hydroxy-6-metoxy-1,4-benzoquinol methylase
MVGNPPLRSSIRAEYETHGVAEFYQQQGAHYANPHEPAIRSAIIMAVDRYQLDLACVLDLACGSGEVTMSLRQLGCQDIQGVDPYTGTAYQKRTGLKTEPLHFEQIAAGALAGRDYSLIVCSFALHLLERSRLPLVCARLAEVSPRLLILTPHKRPALRPEWGWQLDAEFTHQRVRVRSYTSSG